MSPVPSLVGQVTGNLTRDGVRIAGSPQQPNTLRRRPVYSRAGYFNNFPDSSKSQHPAVATPPTYDDTLQEKPLPPSRFKIEPREEEGNEQLPGYTCSLHKEAIFDHKMEMSSPFDRAGKRKWGKTYAVLYGTLLQLHKPKRIPFFSSAKKTQQQAGGPMGYIPGELVRSYTLQLAEVGVAADYRKRHFVIRLRAQTEQFLLSCRTLETFLEWLEALSAAVDLSPSLEERSLPRYHTIPRRRRRRRSARGEQEEIICDLPRRSATPAPTTRHSSIDPRRISASPRRISSIQEPIDEQDLRYFRLGIIPSPSPSPSPRSRSRLQTRLSRLQEEANDISETGKWAPAQNFTVEANMRYARRCMAILCGDAPRQSDYVIKDGKRYKLVYEKKEMVLENRVITGAIAPSLPPAYEEFTKSEGGGGKKVLVSEMGSGMTLSDPRPHIEV